jgi:hypothetical protein
MNHSAKIENAWHALLAAKAFQEANTVQPTVDRILQQVSVAANEGKFDLLIGKVLSEVQSDQRADVYGRLRNKGFAVGRAPDEKHPDQLTEIQVSWREARQPNSNRGSDK